MNFIALVWNTNCCWRKLDHAYYLLLCIIFIALSTWRVWSFEKSAPQKLCVIVKWQILQGYICYHIVFSSSPIVLLFFLSANHSLYRFLVLDKLFQRRNKFSFCFSYLNAIPHLLYFFSLFCMLCTIFRFYLSRGPTQCLNALHSDPPTPLIPEILLVFIISCHYILPLELWYFQPYMVYSVFLQ